LIEVLVATAIIGVVFLCLYSGLAYGFTMIKFSRENQRATQILVEKMDTIRLYNWTQITDPNYVPRSFTNSYYPAGGATACGTIYTGTVEIDKYEFDNPNPTMKTTSSW